MGHRGPDSADGGVAASLPGAIVISGAGIAEVNGIYKATGDEYCGAPTYQHVELGSDYKITREPHTNQKTGKVKHGWLLGVRKQPMYGAPTESLVVPTGNWKKFGGELPVPSAKVYEKLLDVSFAMADDAKVDGDAAVEREDWKSAAEIFTNGIDALKRSGERLSDPFKNRAALLLSRRAACNSKLRDHASALRDAVAALEFVRGLTSAELVAIESAVELGCPDEAAAQKLLELVGNGRILDPGAPLVLRCVERWLENVIIALKGGAEGASLPLPTHMPADRYLDGLDEKTREEVVKRYLPDAMKPDGGNSTMSSAIQCLNLMERWEEVLNGGEFQQRRKELWDRPGLSYPMRLQQTRDLVANSLAGVLEPMGYAEGRPGLSRCVKQMQQFWSVDKACARKALDLEELADVSLADLED